VFLWVVTPRRVAVGYQSFGRPGCLHRQGEIPQLKICSKFDSYCEYTGFLAGVNEVFCVIFLSGVRWRDPCPENIDTPHETGFELIWNTATQFQSWKGVAVTLHVQLPSHWLTTYQFKWRHGLPRQPWASFNVLQRTKMLTLNFTSL